MHPQLYLKTYWRNEYLPQVFVAMSFGSEYDERYKNIYVPAIRSINVNNRSMKPYRVDLSNTGDSIITEIIEGIAHSLIILADVSVIGKDANTGYVYRNENVMYEVGLALATRQPCEVILVRDDGEKLLFDTSYVPHITIDFKDENKAVNTIAKCIKDRLRERELIYDARVSMVCHKLTIDAIRCLSLACRVHDPQKMKKMSENDKSILAILLKAKNGLPDCEEESIRYWLEAGIIERVNQKYEITEFGRAVLKKMGGIT